MPATLRDANEVAIVKPGDPPPPFKSWCDWAWNGYLNSLKGMSGPTGGIKSYHIGTRGLEYQGAGVQNMNVEYWAREVEHWCGIVVPIVGKEVATRPVLRDV